MQHHVHTPIALCVRISVRPSFHLQSSGENTHGVDSKKTRRTNGAPRAAKSIALRFAPAPISGRDIKLDFLYR